MSPKLVTGILLLAGGLPTWLIFAANFGFEASVQISSPAVLAAVGISNIIQAIKDQRKRFRNKAVNSSLDSTTK